MHPFDVARAFLQHCEPVSRSGRIAAVRDLAIAVRRERGQRRREAQAAVDGWLPGWEPDDADLEQLLGLCAEQLTRWWAPRARWAPPVLGQHMVVIDLGAAS